MVHVGLTGGVASGKSSVAALFGELGAHVLDADRLAREVTAPGSAGLQAIVSEFGEAFRTAEGSLDRQALGRLVFDDPQALARLEAIVHPRVQELERQRVRTIAEEDSEAVVIYEAALLLESGGQEGVDRVAVVDVPPELQWQRALARGDRDAEQIRAMLHRQLEREDRLALADDIIDNSGAWDRTRSRVECLFRQYRELAAMEGPSR